MAFKIVSIENDGENSGVIEYEDEYVFFRFN